MQITSWWLQASLWMDMVLNREPSSSRGQEHTHPNPQLPAPNSQMRRRNPPPSQYDTRSGHPERTGSRSKHDIRPGVGELSKNRRWRETSPARTLTSEEEELRSFDSREGGSSGGPLRFASPERLEGRMLDSRVRGRQ